MNGKPARTTRFMARLQLAAWFMVLARLAAELDQPQLALRCRAIAGRAFASLDEADVDGATKGRDA